MPMKMMKEATTAQTTWMIRREGPIVADAAAQVPTGTIEDSRRMIVFDMVASSVTSLQKDGLQNIWKSALRREGLAGRIDAVIDHRGIHALSVSKSCRAPAG
jgi:hypothetical protein